MSLLPEAVVPVAREIGEVPDDYVVPYMIAGEQRTKSVLDVLSLGSTAQAPR
jgi:hypothetical protein